MSWRSWLGALVIVLLVGMRIAAADPAPAAPESTAAFTPAAPARDSLNSGRRGAPGLPAEGDSLALRLVPVQSLGGAEEGRASLAEPSGVASDAFGRVYVTDAAQHRLVRFDPHGAWLGEAGALGSDPGDLRRPAGVAPVGSLGVGVLDRENRRIVLYDLFGRLVGVLADLTALEDQLGRVDPVALAADRGGALYVADADRDRVLVLDFSGRFVRALGGYGTGAGSFRGLVGLGVGPHGELVCAERTGARLQWLDAGGTPLTAWPLAVQAGRGLLAVAVDDSSRVAVADEGAGRLWLFGSTGRLLAARDDLASPRALAFARDGSLLVAEGGAGRVRRFTIQPTGTSAPPGR
jgi:DNA-binding beta-propeller fold protein YncE